MLTNGSTASALTRGIGRVTNGVGAGVTCSGSRSAWISANARSAALWNRSQASCASAHPTRYSTTGGTVTPVEQRLGAGPIRRAASCAIGVLAVNGGWPVSISNRTQPRA